MDKEPRIDQVGPFTVVGADAKTVDIMQARGAFAEQYCREKGWPLDFAELSLKQIVEIRKQDGWKNPLKENPDVTSGL